MTIVIEISGMKLHGHHGVLEQERAAGQLFLLDVVLDLAGGPPRDRIEDAVDYREVARAVRSTFETRSFQLLETLAQAIAADLLAQFAVTRAHVRVSKPALSLEGGAVSVSAERARPPQRASEQ